MNPFRSLLSIMPLALVCGCITISKEQQQTVTRAAEIDSYPVSRGTLIKGLGLHGVPSERATGGVRGGQIWFIETWTLSNGLQVSGWDSQHAGAITINARTIDDILNNPSGARNFSGTSDFVDPFPELSLRRSFKRVTVSTSRDRLIFDSSDSIGSNEAPRIKEAK